MQFLIKYHSFFTKE